MNTQGSFTCVCNSGYQNFIAYEGCSDIDDCVTGLIGLNYYYHSIIVLELLDTIQIKEKGDSAVEHRWKINLCRTCKKWKY